MCNFCNFLKTLTSVTFVTFCENNKARVASFLISKNQSKSLAGQGTKKALARVCAQIMGDTR